MQLLKIIIFIILGSGLGSFLAQKLFEHRLNKKLFRFSRLYSDKLDVIRELYRLLIKAEIALNLLLSKGEPDDKQERQEFRTETFERLDAFIRYFEENEILFDDSVTVIVNQFREKFCVAKQKHDFATMLESARGKKVWADAVEDIIALQKEYRIVIPVLKEKLKIEFQEKYNLLSK